MSKRLAAAIITVAFLAPATASAQDGPVVASLKGLHDTTKDNITATADIVPEDLYGFRPTEEVRTMGQILAHVANAQFLFCSAAAGEASPNSENFEETRTTKAQIIAALNEGFAYCDRVYGNTTDAAGATMRDLFGQQMAASAVLAFNSAHNYEHYGNLVTYMRINGIVPPSSR